MERPFAYSVYHIVSVPKAGATVFAPLAEALEAVSPETRARWERMYMVGSGGRVVHPLVYPHPLTGRPTMCFHTGMTGECLHQADI